MKKKKEGLSRLLEIAGQKKGLLLLAGLLSVGSAMCMLVPYWAVYEVLKELLLHGSNPVLANGTEMIRWGMDRTGWTCRRIGFAVRCPYVLSCSRIPNLVWVACPFIRTYR